ncbi:hypothetical protein HOK51_04715 [Candidatus Woesearchaeota archaeon]|jgi:hypothetical protein|nr:hypothetical protein [Candidatus Woesearchaeota archaeon]MBT6519127.1 hypothetical protein [Candidatus Woesearchaeota archaeon]MBT7367760.1 hypothetical protein [Candidatus Woesearchaeota archaeon]
MTQQTAKAQTIENKVDDVGSRFDSLGDDVRREISDKVITEFSDALSVDWSELCVDCTDYESFLDIVAEEFIVSAENNYVSQMAESVIKYFDLVPLCKNSEDYELIKERAEHVKTEKELGEFIQKSESFFQAVVSQDQEKHKQRCLKTLFGTREEVIQSFKEAKLSHSESFKHELKKDGKLTSKTRNDFVKKLNYFYQSELWYKLKVIKLDLPENPFEQVNVKKILERKKHSDFDFKIIPTKNKQKEVTKKLINYSLRRYLKNSESDQINKFNLGYALRTIQLEEMLGKLTKNICKQCVTEEEYHRGRGCCDYNHFERYQSIDQWPDLHKEELANARHTPKNKKNHCAYHNEQGCALELYKPMLCIAHLCPTVGESLNEKYPSIDTKSFVCGVGRVNTSPEFLFGAMDTAIQKGYKLLSQIEKQEKEQ